MNKFKRLTKAVYDMLDHLEELERKKDQIVMISGVDMAGPEGDTTSVVTVVNGRIEALRIARNPHVRKFGFMGGK